MTPFAIVFLSLLLLKAVTEVVLEVLNLRAAQAAAGSLPEVAKGVMDEATYAKSNAYTQDKARFALVNHVWDAAFLAALLPTGGLAKIWSLWSGLGSWTTGTFGQALVFFLTFWTLGLPGLILDYWNHFRLEQKHGFNKMTPALWLADLLKGWVLGLVLTLILVPILLWITGLGTYWWLGAWGVVFGFMLFMAFVGGAWLMKLFHKFEPLADIPLRDRLLALANRTGFACDTILMMDGSKRSAHSNAFFMGFGKARRIVLFDTLVKQLTPGELEAVLAHEIGHFRCGHIPRRLVVSGFMTLFALWLVDLLLRADWFKAAFTFESGAGLAPVLLLFTLAGGVVTFWSTPVSSFFSRKQEFEADAFANKAMGGSAELIQALRKLYQNNLGNLTPHPLYSSFYYSHPVLPEREGAMPK